MAGNAIAFKEWAVVCAALDSGRQSVILRKGGLHEGRDGFRVAHREFWLFPTRFHQSPEELAEEARPLWEDAAAGPPPDGTVRIANFVVVEEADRISDAAVLPRLAGLHVWSERTLDERFHYREPGLFALLVRVYRLPRAIELPDSPHFAGCRSWVDLPGELPTAGLQPMLSDTEHEQGMLALRRALSAVSLA